MRKKNQIDFNPKRRKKNQANSEIKADPSLNFIVEKSCKSESINRTHMQSTDAIVTVSDIMVYKFRGISDENLKCFTHFSFLKYFIIRHVI